MNLLSRSSTKTLPPVAIAILAAGKASDEETVSLPLTGFTVAHGKYAAS